MKNLTDILSGVSERLKSFEAAEELAHDSINQLREHKNLRETHEQVTSDILEMLSGHPVPVVISTMGTLIGFIASNMEGNTKLLNEETGEERIINANEYMFTMFRIAEMAVKSAQDDDCQCEVCVARRKQEADTDDGS